MRLIVIAALVVGCDAQRGAATLDSPVGAPDVAVDAPATASAPPSAVTARPAPAASIPPPSSCPSRPLSAWSFSPDGSMLATRCAGHECSQEEIEQYFDLWQLGSGGHRAFDAGAPHVQSFVWSSAGQLAVHAAEGTGPGAASVFELKSGAVLARADHYCITQLAFDHAGKSLLVPGCDGGIQMLDLTTGRARARPESETHRGGDYGVLASFTADDRGVLVEDEDAGLQLLGRDLRRRRSLGSDMRTTSSARSPDGSRIAAIGSGKLEIASTKTLMRERGVKLSESFEFGDVRWLDDARVVASDAVGQLITWDAAHGGAESVVLESPSRYGLSTLALDASRSTLASAAPDCVVRVFDAAKLTLRWQKDLGCGEEHVTPEVAFASDGRLVVHVAGGRLELLDVASGAPAGSGFDKVAAIALAPDGQSLAAVIGEQAVVIGVREAKIKRSLPLGVAPVALGPLGWSPDGKLLAISIGDLLLLRADGQVLRLGAFAKGKQRLGAAWSLSGKVAGPSELSACLPGASAPALISDFVAGRPL